MRDEIERLLTEVKSSWGTPDLTDEEIREIWHEVLKRSVIHKYGYNLPRGIVIEKPKEREILTDLYKHEKWEIPYTDEWVKYTIFKDLWRWSDDSF